MYVIIFTNSIRWNEYWSQLYDTTYFMKKGEMRIAVYNLQCAVCYCMYNDHIKTEL